MAQAPRKKSESRSTYLGGQLLLAMPNMIDRRFRRAVIYICSHNADGAMGLIVNQRAENITFSDLLRQLNVAEAATAPAGLLDVPVQVGGPVSTERGFVLHSSDYRIEDATVTITKDICLTSTIEILRAMASGKGPQRALLALGYSGWAPGQLEAEIQANGWLHCAADRDLVFGADLELKYDRALSKLGIDLSHLVSEAGHA
jgi:putative transcriptional regulator